MASLKNTPKFKKCTLVTSPGYNGFGFKINKEFEPKFMICVVEKGSPASRANIGEKDVLVEINNKNIRRSKFDKVKELLSRAVGDGKVELLVISMEGYLWFKAKNKRFSSKLTTIDNVEFFSSLNVAEKGILRMFERGFI
jgi:C-terminal processing protease CtpA/Prc